MVKGISFVLEAFIAGIIIMVAIATFFAANISTESGASPLRQEGFRCLSNVDNSGNLRSAVISDDTSFIDDEISNCLESAINHEILICRNQCSASSAPDDVQKVLVDYYIAGYTDKNPARVVLVMWQ